jgi:hypothetical protein
LNLAKGIEKGTDFHDSENCFQGETMVFKGMVAYVPLATHTPREEHTGLAVATPSYATLFEWHNRGGGNYHHSPTVNCFLDDFTHNNQSK